MGEKAAAEAMTLAEAARVLGAAGGRVKSAKKTTAVRKNAKRGGWPKGKPRKTEQQ
jgi:hypothetical protein